MGGPILPPVQLPWGVYTPGTPNNLATVNTLQGDAGDAADGFDDAFALVEDVFTVLDAGAATSDTMIGTLSDAISVYDSLQDTLDAELAVAAAVADGIGQTLSSILSLIPSLGSAPPQIGLPGIPGIASLIVPQPVDLTSLVSNLLAGVLTQFEQDVINDLDGYLASLIASSGFGGGGGLPPGGGGWYY